MTNVLVVTNSYDDPHVNAVRGEIERLGGKLTRFDVDLLVMGQNQVSFDYRSDRSVVTLTTQKGQTSPGDVQSVWYRKPYGFGGRGFVESVNDPVQRAAVAKDVRAAMCAVFEALDDRFWLNTPGAIRRGQLKPYQIRLARDAGLAVPDTIITNDPAVARDFCQLGSTVFKPLAASTLEYSDGPRFVETTLITEAEVGLLELIRPQPVILQRYIEKSCELRVTYVNGEMFVARQELGSVPPQSVVDWRALQGTADSTYAPGELEAATATKVRILMRALGLRFGALDFAVDQSGNTFFLEVNANGQWLSYTDQIGLPAASAIARCLVRRERAHKS